MVRHRSGDHASRNPHLGLCPAAGRDRGDRRSHRRLAGRSDAAVHRRHLPRADYHRHRRRGVRGVHGGGQRVRHVPDHQRAGAHLRRAKGQRAGAQGRGLLVHPGVGRGCAADRAGVGRAGDPRRAVRSLPSLSWLASLDAVSGRQGRRLCRRGRGLRHRHEHRPRGL